MARGTAECLIKERDTGPHGVGHTTWCGNRYAWKTTSYPFGSICPKCAAKFFPTITPAALTLEKLDVPTWREPDAPNPYDLNRGLKSAYLAKHESEPVAIIQIDEGWGEKWTIRALTSHVEDDGETIRIVDGGTARYHRHSYANDGSHMPPTTTIGDKVYENRTSENHEAKRFPSKFAALFYIGDMLTDGHLKTETTLRTERAAKIIERRERIATRAREEAEREVWREQQRVAREEAARKAKDELDLIAWAFAELTTEGKISNFQHDAVLSAAKRLGIEGLEG